MADKGFSLTYRCMAKERRLRVPAVVSINGGFYSALSPFNPRIIFYVCQQTDQTTHHRANLNRICICRTSVLKMHMCVQVDSSCRSNHASANSQMDFCTQFKCGTLHNESHTRKHRL
ncbi:hypothetical protein OUZ56_020112 [Daphnia magna]|uniref:Uncharacterized protein n=1 Tax=Daphnia magna TaxID=35525 RepID=A0ABQ9ZDL3_9CRUS|nr:hypothetical protein OUZ56_020112 [Daphnia magna]